MIKKAMILAAGLGTRLRPMTNVRPKPLVPVCNRSLIAHHLLSLAEMGVEEVMINLHHLPTPIQEGIGDGSRWGVRVHYSIETPEILGTGGGLAQVESFFRDEPAFLFLNGDILHSIDLRAAIAHHFESEAAATLLVRPHPGDPKMGWVEVDDAGNVRRVPDMPGQGFSKAMFTGLHVISPQIFPHLEQGKMSCILRTGYRAMIEQGLRVAAYRDESSDWFDIGNPSSYLHTNFALLQQMSSEERAFPASTQLHGDVERGALLGENVKISSQAKLSSKCIVGENSSIGEGTQLDECVVWSGTHVPPNSRFHRAILFEDQVCQVHS